MAKPQEERTLVLIKPDGVKRGLVGEVLGRLEKRGLKIIALQMIWPSREEMDNHYPKDMEWITRLGAKTLSTYEKYKVNPMEEFGTDDPAKIGPEIRKWLLDYMLSAPLVKMVVEGTHAVDTVRKICGPTLPYLADMGTIRGDFSNDSPVQANVEKRAVANILHASETLEEVAHEIEHWFGNKKMYSYKRHGE